MSTHSSSSHSDTLAALPAGTPCRLRRDDGGTYVGRVEEHVAANGDEPAETRFHIGRDPLGIHVVTIFHDTLTTASGRWSYLGPIDPAVSPTPENPDVR
jgi:hypothetical protein